MEEQVVLRADLGIELVQRKAGPGGIGHALQDKRLPSARPPNGLRILAVILRALVGVVGSAAPRPHALLGSGCDERSRHAEP